MAGAFIEGQAIKKIQTRPNINEDLEINENDMETVSYTHLTLPTKRIV